MSKESQLVMVADPAQIDHPYVDSRSNGLVFMRKKYVAKPLLLMSQSGE